MLLALQQVSYVYKYSSSEFLYSILYLVYYKLEINLFLCCQIQKSLTIVRDDKDLVSVFLHNRNRIPAILFYKKIVHLSVQETTFNGFGDFFILKG